MFQSKQSVYPPNVNMQKAPTPEQKETPQNLTTKM